MAIGAPVTLMVAASAYGDLGGRGGIDFAADAPVRLQPCARMAYGYRVTDCVIAQSDVPGTFPVRAMAHQGPRAITMLEVVAPEDYATVNLAVSPGSIGAVLYTAEQHTIVGARCDWIVEGAPDGTTFTQAPVPVPAFVNLAWDTLTIHSPTPARVKATCTAAGRALRSAMVTVD